MISHTREDSNKFVKLQLTTSPKFFPQTLMGKITCILFLPWRLLCYFRYKQLYEKELVEEGQKNVMLESRSSNNKNIEENKTKKNSDYFNSKKKLFVFLWSGALLLLLFLTFHFLLQINLISFFKTLISKSTNKYFLFSITFGCLLFFINELTLQVLIYRSRFERLHKIRFKDWIFFVIITFFIQSITPFSIGAEPYAIWWLCKKGINLKKSAAIVSVNSCSWFISQFLITWPSFIFLTIKNYEKIDNYPSYWFILTGLLVDVLIGLIIFLISYNKYIHYYFAVAVNKFKSFLYLNSLSKNELTFKYLINHSFKRIFVNEFKSKKTILTVLLLMIQNFLLYSLFAFVVMIFSDSGEQTNFWDFYHMINVSTTANNFLPSPSSEGTLQATILSLSNGFLVTKPDHIGNIIFLWRWFSKYQGLLIGIGCLVIFGFNPKFIKPKKYYQYLDTY